MMTKKQRTEIMRNNAAKARQAKARKARARAQAATALKPVASVPIDVDHYVEEVRDEPAGSDKRVELALALVKLIDRIVR